MNRSHWKGPFAAVFLLAVTAGLAQTTPQAPVTQEPQVRVVGQPTGQADAAAWTALTQAPPESQGQMAMEFLRNYPKSGLTPFAHRMVAIHALRDQNYADFVMHAEEALKEIPQAFDLQGQLAYYYTENKDFKKAEDRAKKLLFVVDTTTRPAGVAAGDWQQGADQAAAAGHYALGLSYFSKVGENPQDANCQASVEHFGMATELNPRDAYAYYRLASAYRFQEKLALAAENYAKTAALGGPAEPIAMGALKEVLSALEKDPETAPAMVEEQKQKLEQAASALAEKYVQLNKSSMEQQPPQ